MIQSPLLDFLAHLCKNRMNFWIFLNNYHYIQLNYTSRFLALSTSLLVISLIQSANGAQFLNFGCLSFLSAALAASSATAPKTVMVA